MCSCAFLPARDYQIKPVQVLPVESYPARVSLSRVTVAANPYSTDEQSYTVFDVKDLNSKGFYPVLVIVRNDTPNQLVMRTRNVVLRSEDGQELYVTPATLVVQDVIGGQSTSTKAGSPLLDFTGKELTTRSIPPGEVEHGIIFFYTSNRKKNLFQGSTLVIPLIRDESGQQDLGPFQIPLDPGVVRPAGGKER